MLTTDEIFEQLEQEEKEKAEKKLALEKKKPLKRQRKHLPVKLKRPERM